MIQVGGHGEDNPNVSWLGKIILLQLLFREVKPCFKGIALIIFLTIP